MTFRRLDLEECQFDIWRDSRPIRCALGKLHIEIHTDLNVDLDDRQTQLASWLAEFTKQNDELLLDLIYGHYKWAEEQDHWLSFWETPAGLSRSDMLAHTHPIPEIHDACFEDSHFAVLNAYPDWDQEHGLPIMLEDDRIVDIGGITSWGLDQDGVLRF